MEWGDDSYFVGEKLAALKAWGEKVRRAHEVGVITEMETALLSVPDMPSVADNQAPAPGDWHPYYENLRSWLLNWLDHEPGQRMVVPVPRVYRFVFAEEPAFLPEPLRTTTLTKQQAWGAAPYVGEPFIYTWPCASDERGRWIAGTAVIQNLR